MNDIDNTIDNEAWLKQFEEVMEERIASGDYENAQDLIGDAYHRGLKDAADAAQLALTAAKESDEQQLEDAQTFTSITYPRKLL